MSGALVAATPLAFAQGTDRSAITGRVVDPSGAPVPGITVSAASPALIGGSRQSLTGPDGGYRLVDLAPGIYRLQASVKGFKPAVRNDVHLAADATVVLDLDLEIESRAESVSVSAVVPVVDVRSSEAPYRLTADLVANLPTSREISDLMNLLPGINADIGLGGVQGANPVFIDGVNVTEEHTMHPWASFNYNWVEDIQVIGVGAGAEYGEFSGVIQKSRLRSGGNRFSGLGEYRTTRPGWVGTNTSSLTPSLQSSFAARSERIAGWHDLNVQVGGPLRRDRLWFFGGVQEFRTSVTPALYAGPDSIDTRNRRVLAKIDGAFAGSLRAGGYYEYDRSRVRGAGLGPLTAIEATTTDVQPDHNWHLRASRMLGQNITLEIDHAGATGIFSSNPTPPATRSGPSPHYDLVTDLASVSSPFFDVETTRRTVGATMTLYLAGHLARHHVLKLGVEHEWSAGALSDGYPGGRFYLDADGAPYEVLLHDDYRQSTGERRASVHLEDEWAVADRLTLQPGVRASFNRGAVSQGTVLATTSISPRIGAVWDVARDHRTAVRLHYGRYHDAALGGQFSFVEARLRPPEIEALVVGPNEFVEVSRTAEQQQFAMDPDIAQGFFDQWVAAVEHEVWPSTSLTVQYIRRRYGDSMGFVDRGSIYAPVIKTDPGPDNRVGTADDGGPVTVFRKTNPGSELYYFTNPAGLDRRYDAVQVVARKHYGRLWQIQGSYAWSKTRGNAVNGLLGNTTGPDLGSNGVSANPNQAINAYGPTPWDFTHEVKVLGTWRVSHWGGVNVSGVYQFHGGIAWGRTVRFPDIEAGAFGVRIEPRGTRRTKALNTLDLRVEKTVRVANGSRLGLFADVFNVGNQGIPDPSARRPVVDFSGPSFGQPVFWLSPRIVRAGVRVSF
jgi:hypothetical protein